MKNYDGMNHSFGTHFIQVLFQSFQYKGSMTYQIGGNCKGLDVFPRDGMSIIESLETAKFEGMSIKPYDDEDGWLAEVNLTDANGDTCQIDVADEVELESMIVGIRIIDFQREEENG